MEEESNTDESSQGERGGPIELIDFNFSSLGNNELKKYASKIFAELNLRGITYTNWENLENIERSVFNLETHTVEALKEIKESLIQKYNHEWNPKTPEILGLPQGRCPTDNMSLMIRPELLLGGISVHPCSKDYISLLESENTIGAWNWILNNVVQPMLLFYTRSTSDSPLDFMAKNDYNKIINSINDRIKTDSQGIRMPDRMTGQDGLAEMRTFLIEANKLTRQMQHFMGSVPPTGTIPVNIISPPAPQMIIPSVKPSQTLPVHTAPVDPEASQPKAKRPKIGGKKNYIC